MSSDKVTNKGVHVTTDISKWVKRLTVPIINMFGGVKRHSVLLGYTRTRDVIYVPKYAYYRYMSIDNEALPDVSVIPINNKDKATLMDVNEEHNLSHISLSNFFNYRHLLSGNDYYAKHTPIEITFTGTLRPMQTYASDVCFRAIRYIGGGIISLPCGEGKTILAINLLCLLKVKTLIVVNRLQLIDQWIDSIVTFTNYTKDDIGILQGKDITDNACRSIVFTTVQSLSKKDYTCEIDRFHESFGCTIYDECHHMSADFFSNTMKKCNTKYTIGLSATPKRKDKLEHVLTWYIGPMLIYKPYKEVRANVEVYDFNCTNEEYLVIPKTITGNVNLSRYLTDVCDIEERNAFIADIIIKYAKDTARNIIVLSGRISQLHRLREIVDLSDDAPTTSMYIGGMSIKNLKISEDAQVIFGSYSMASEGLDIPKLNTLILASSVTDIQQSIGRIMRVKNPDVIPTIVDILDSSHILYNQYKKRHKVYKNNGLCIKMKS